VPVQALFGSRSPLQAVGVDRLRAAVPGWRVEVIPGAGHTLVMDAEDQVIERVLAFPSPAPTGEGS
jgi:pimeloyl-ACP methyl ester carboxylesterase